LTILFFSNSSFQNKISTSIVGKINDQYQIDLSIKNTSINYDGKIILKNVIVNDHKLENLLSVSEILISYNEFLNILKGLYSFENVFLSGLEFNIKQYPGDKENNLIIFLNKIQKKEIIKNISNVFSSKSIQIRKGEFRIHDNLNNKVVLFELENIELINLIIEKSTISTKIKDAIFNNSDYYIKDFSGTLLLNKQSLLISDISVHYGKSLLKANLNFNIRNIDLDKIKSTVLVTGEISESKLNIVDLPQANKFFKNNQEFIIKSDFNGTLDKLVSNIKLYNQERDFSINSSLSINNLFSKSNNQAVTIDLKRLDLRNNFFNKVLNDSINEKINTYSKNIDSLSVNGKINFSMDEFIFDLTSTSNIGKINSKIEIEILSNNTWSYTSQINLEETKLGKLLNLKQVNQVTGLLKFDGIFNQKDGFKSSWQSNFERIDFSYINLNDISSNGYIDNKNFKIWIKSNSANFNFSGNFNFNFNNPYALNFNFNLNKINLSKLKLASSDKEIYFKGIISSSMSEKFKQNNFNRMLTVKSPKIFNIKNEIDFNDFNINYIKNDLHRKIVIDNSDALKLNFSGDFLYTDIKDLIINSLSNIYPFIKSNRIIRDQYFNFNLELNNNLVTSLFPDLSVSDKSFLKGKINSKNVNSFMEINFPFLQFDDFRLENIDLKTNPLIKEYSSKLSVKKVFYKKNVISDLNLSSSKVNDTLFFILESKKLNNSNGFIRADIFHFVNEKGVSVIKFNPSVLNFKNKNWFIIGNEDLPMILFNPKLNRYQIENFNFYLEDQKISFTGHYLSLNQMNLTFLLEKVSLEDVIPNNDKLDFKGISNLKFVINRQGGVDQSEGVFKIKNFSINKKSYGDFKFNFLSDSNSYEYIINSTIKEKDKISFKSQGKFSFLGEEVNSEIDFIFNNFDLSFLSKLGKDKIKNITGSITGEASIKESFFDPKINGSLKLNNTSLYIPYTNTTYKFNNNSSILLSDENFEFNNTLFYDSKDLTSGILNGKISHKNFKNWYLDLNIDSQRLLVINKLYDEKSFFYGRSFLEGTINLIGPTKNLIIDVAGSTAKGTSITIPWQDSKGLLDTSFIDFMQKDIQNKINNSNALVFDESLVTGLEMTFNLEVNKNAELEIVVDQASGSTIKGRGSGKILMETNIDGKFNIWGDFISDEGIYNFKNLGLIDKKFKLSPGGTIVWDGNPIDAEMNLEAIYQVPGGANPSILLDNPNFNKKIPTNVSIKLQGNLLKPDNPNFQISFPNTSGTVVSEINYRLSDKQRRQLQAISLLSQGLFISEVSISPQGIANNLYEKASEVFSSLIGDNQGKLNVGLNYLKGDKSSALDIKTEDRIGVTLSTQISDNILINGKIGVPIDGVEETLIVGDVQIDFILNEEGSLKAKVFNKENEFKYIGDELGYTQGIGISYEVDFDTFQNLINKIVTNKKGKGLKK